MQNKYYFDEFYDKVLVQPLAWFSETFSYIWMDRKVIDGVLHFVARISHATGLFFRDVIDGPIINGSGDLVATVAQWLGSKFKFIQTGKVQQYMLIALVFVFAALFYFVFNGLQ